jgi:hypothetical protein
MKIIIGSDNGSTGSIGILHVDDNNTITKSQFILTPCKTELGYQKKARNISRLDYPEFCNLLDKELSFGYPITAVVERPYTGTFVNTAVVAGRCLEGMIIAFEQKNISYTVVDSKGWQKAMLPGIKTSKMLKSASKDVGCRLFPEHKALITKHKDADGILIAEWVRVRGF